ncbi:MAG: aspartate-semialdehyde dehydrogenase [bacterium]
MSKTLLNKGVHIAIVGATGVVGQEILKVLEERKFPVAVLTLLASERSAGKRLVFNDENVVVETLTKDSFKGVDIALFSAGGSLSKEFAPIAVEAGATVIDNTSHFRMDPHVPLVVPEVNAEAMNGHHGIIANPNCSTAQLMLALKPIYEAFGIVRVVISTYQSVSGAGSAAIRELESSVRRNLSGQDVTPEVFTKQIAFNLIPHIDVFVDNGYTKEEMKMVNETKKIFGDESIHVSATCVRVPVFVGHSESVNVICKKQPDIKKLRKLYGDMEGVTLMDDPSKNVYPTPREISGTDPVYIGRLRQDISHDFGLEMWVVADNLRKGAALNAVQIAERLI